MITFTHLTPESFDDFAGLFQQEKGTVRAHQRPSCLPWSFLSLPGADPDLPTVELAWSDGELVGCMGAVPQTLLFGEEEIPAAFFVDWLVAVEARRQRIGSQLINRAAERFPVAIHMGSTPEGYATCATLGAVDCGSSLTARRVLRPWSWSAHAAQNALPFRLGWSAIEKIRGLFRPQLQAEGLTLEEVDPQAVDGRLQSFSRQLARTHVCTLRSGPRWHWLLNSPLYQGRAYAVRRQGEWIGFVALVVGWRGGRLLGTVADICMPRIEEAVPLLAAAVYQLAQMKVDGISCTISSDIGQSFLDKYAFTLQNDARMGTWLHPGLEKVLDRPWFMTMAENLAVAAGIDIPD